MYCFLLVVDDVAGNHRMARKFVLFDDVNEVEVVPDADKAMVVKSAAANTSFTWITELNNPVRNGGFFRIFSKSIKHVLKNVNDASSSSVLTTTTPFK